MKRLWIGALALTLLLAGCGSSRHPYFPNDFAVLDGEFSVTPEEFVSAWNTYLENEQSQNPDDTGLGMVLPLPDYVEDGASEELGQSMMISYYVDPDSGHLSEFRFTLLYSIVTAEDCYNTYLFLCDSLPGFFNPNTDLESLGDEFPLFPRSLPSYGSCEDEGIAYTMVGTEYDFGMGSIDILTVSAAPA